MYVVLAVFAIYAFLPSVALSARPVHAASAQDVANVSKYQCTAQQGLQVGDRTSDLACRFAGDPVAGVVDHLGLPDTITSGLAFYVAILAATILIIATNAGIIGVSRLTYSMGQHRQLPEAIRRVHPKYNTPYIAIILYSLIAILLMIPNGAVSFLGNLYAFGAMLSFTLAHASVVWMRHTMPDETCPGAGPRRSTWAATTCHVRDPGRHRHLRLVAGDGVPARLRRGAPVGLIWLVLGMVVYYTYRRSQHLPLTRRWWRHTR
jgi:APA family basic amino acid/polyamine antiporter